MGKEGKVRGGRRGESYSFVPDWESEKVATLRQLNRKTHFSNVF